MPIDLHKAFSPIGMVGEQPIGMAVNKDVPASSVAELVVLINKTQGGMLFGATNRGGQSHLTGELFRDRAKVNLSFVHAAGAAASLNDVIAGAFRSCSKVLQVSRRNRGRRHRSRYRRAKAPT
jgi:tripartite-type tricarboxylate transporter receptor subunit TctC